MDVFPFFLLRQAALPFNFIENLEYKEGGALLRSYFEQLGKKDSLKESLCALLHEKIRLIDGEEKRKNLINFKRDVYNERVKISELKEIYCSITGSVSLENSLSIIIERYHQCDALLSSLIGDLRDGFTSTSKSIRKYLLTYARNEILRKGLVLSSQAFLRELNSLDSNKLLSSITFTNMDLGVFKYLSRIAAKTSPFSVFTNVSIGRVSPLDGSLATSSHDVQIESHVKINGFLLKAIKTLFQTDPAVNLYLKVQLNSTVIDEGDTYLFLASNFHIDALQRIKKNEIIELIKTRLDEANSNDVLLRSLADSIANILGFNHETVLRLLMNLIDVGFLELDLDCPGDDPNWPDTTLKEIIEIESVSGLVNLPLIGQTKDFLALLNSTMVEYPTADSEKRLSLLTKIQEEFKTLTALNTVSRSKVKEQSEKAYFIKNSLSHFEINSEHLLYEDALGTKCLTLDEKQVRHALLDIHRINDLIISRFPSKEKQAVLEFYRAKFDNNKPVNFLNFYEEYHKGTTVPDDQNEYDYNLSDDDREFFERHFECSKNTNDIINFKIKRENDSDTDQKPPRSFGILLQPYLHNGSLQFVVNFNTVGFGRLTSRFLYMFEPEVTQEIRKWNRSCDTDSFYIENNDETYYNANIHPPLLEHQVVGSVNSNEDSECEQIKINEMFVYFNEKLNCLQLSDRDRTKFFNVIDLGFQDNKYRSKYFQFLNNFTWLNAASIKSFNTFLNGRYSYKLGNVLVHPRLVYKDKLVFQRKCWSVLKNDLPVTIKKENDFDLFIRVNRWRHSLSIPDECFIQRPKKKQEEYKNDDHKPQYVNFLSIVSLHILMKTIKRVDKLLLFFEMKPCRNELVKFGTEKYMTEIWAQWYTKI